jgi:hypothetical protein
VINPSPHPIPERLTLRTLLCVPYLLMTMSKNISAGEHRLQQMTTGSMLPWEHMRGTALANRALTVER